jgi:hypothetical protein
VELEGSHYESPTRARQNYHAETKRYHTTKKSGRAVAPGGFMDPSQIRNWASEEAEDLTRPDFDPFIRPMGEVDNPNYR